MNSIYVENYSVNCALGSSKLEVAKQLFCDDPKFTTREVLLLSGKRTLFFTAKEDAVPLPERLSQYSSRNNKIAYSCLLEIENDIENSIKKWGKDRVAVVCASSTSGISCFEEFYFNRSAPSHTDTYTLDRQEIGNLSSFVSEYFDTCGPAYTISTACSSGPKAIAEAYRLLDAQLCDAVIVGASDSYCELTLNGFDSLEAISATRCQAFSVNRSGINIGEGAAFFLLSRNATGHRLLGIGESSDSFHISSPEPEGVGAEKAIRDSLLMANLCPTQIDYINLHGTGTEKNDQMEAKLIDRVFGKNIPVSSTKALVGHCLGAAGSIELAFCLMCISELNTKNSLPEHFGDKQWDPSLPKLNFVTANSSFQGNTIMSNSFAFGGSNVSVIVGTV